jgi:hypothetical protein
VQRAIKINERESIIVLATREHANQLTPAGIHPVEVVHVKLLEARGLAFIAAGIAVRQPEDEPDDFAGMKLALGRALRESGFNKEERQRVFATLLDAEQPQVPVYMFRGYPTTDESESYDSETPNQTRQREPVVIPLESSPFAELFRRMNMGTRRGVA